MDDATIICDEVVTLKKTNFSEKNLPCKTKNVYILLFYKVL